MIGLYCITVFVISYNYLIIHFIGQVPPEDIYILMYIKYSIATYPQPLLELFL